LAEKGKAIVSTATGRELYDTLPDTAKYPDMTALWHEQQKTIQSGQGDTVSFVLELMQYITGEVERVKREGIGIKVDRPPCPACGKPLHRVKKKDKDEYFWGCSGYAEGCRYSCDDKDGKPVPKAAATVSDAYKCKVCGKGLSRKPGKNKNKGTFWWGCSGYPDCKQTYPDIKGKPDYSKKAS